jgi:CDP-diacylglycerol--glycerol-3-phosphate 3-phosphatidyltransferase
LISNSARERIRGVFEPIALGLGRLGLSPDALTLLGFAITVLGAVFLGTQQWLIGGIVVLVGGVFDLFDGTLARATGRVSKWGAFLDSTLDKAGEAIVYIAIAVGMSAGGRADAVPLAAAAMAAAFMVSYTRARAEGLGFSTGRGMASIGLAPREVRIVILTLGLLLTGAFSSSALVASLALIAILATITTIQRILHVFRQRSNKEHP